MEANAMCRNARRRERWANDPEYRAREGARRYARYHAHKHDADYQSKILKRLYGISQADYDVLLARQGGVCAICGRRPKRGRLYVDHCHVTGRVRGLLCRGCNFALGHLRDNQRTMIAALAYLAGGAADGAGAAAQRALLARAALPPGPTGRAVLTEVHLPNRFAAAPLARAAGIRRRRRPCP
jgi:hypothetical protein